MMITNNMTLIRIIILVLSVVLFGCGFLIYYYIRKNDQKADKELYNDNLLDEGDDDSEIDTMSNDDLFRKKQGFFLYFKNFI